MNIRRLTMQGLTAVVLVAVASACDSSPSSSEPPPAAAEGSLQVTAAGPDAGVAGVSLTLTRSGQSARTGTTGANGQATFGGLVVGSWTLAIEAPQGWSLAAGESASRSVSISEESTTEVTVQLVPASETASIGGLVVHDGAGVGGVEVEVRSQAGASHSVVTPDNGTFHFGDLDAGEWTLEIHPPAWFELGSGEPGVHDITLESTPVQREIVLAPVGGQQVVEIEAGALTFVPASVTVAPGTRIGWVNQQAIHHTVTPTGHSAWNTGMLHEAGDQFSVVLNNPGEYSYVCEPHSAEGMTGQITVEP